MALSAIWFEIYPALAPIRQKPINPFFVPSEGVEPITVGSFLFALLVVCLSVIGWRNIPGLVDVLLLGRLGVESSIRYALSLIHI